MSTRPVIMTATTAALATAVIALVALLGGVVADNVVAARVGLACLFAVPVVRNVAVVVFGDGRDRALAVVGIVVVLGVAGATAVSVANAAAPLDRASPDLTTSDHD